MSSVSARRAEGFTDLAARAISLWIDSARAIQAARPMDAIRSSLDRLGVPVEELPTVSLERLRTAGCDVPPPCWWPREDGSVTSYVCAGATAVLRIEVVNCGPTRRAFTVDAPDGVAVDQPKLDLGPMERAVVTVRREAAGEGLVWIRGCCEHYVRWTVRTSRRAASACHELVIEDCPDYRHHWYDHFYCERPCPAGQRD